MVRRKRDPISVERSWLIHKWGWLLLGLFLAGCNSGKQPPAVPVGHVAPLTGPERENGTSALQGIQLAVQESAQDKFQSIGAAVVVSHADARPTKSSFEGDGLRLVTVNQAVALLGGRTAEQVSALDQGFVPVISPSGFAGRKKSPFVFLTGLTPARKGKALARAAIEKLPAIISVRDVTGLLSISGPCAGLGTVVAAAVMKETLTARGSILIVADQRQEDCVLAAEAFLKEIELSDPFSSGFLTRPVLRPYSSDKDLEDLAARLEEEHPRIIFLAGAVPAAERLRQKLKGSPCPILFAGAEGCQKDLLANPQTSDNLVLASAWAPEADTPENRTFLKNYRAAFNNEPDVNAALAHDNARLLFEAMSLCNKVFTNKKIQEKLSELKDFPGLTGKVSFDGDRVLQRPVFIVQLGGGRPVLIQRQEP